MLKRYLLLTVLFGTLLLTGCGEKEELIVFKENVSAFYTEVAAIEAEILFVDEQSEDAVAVLLTQLEQLSAQFQQLAEWEVPEEFISVEALADDAADYMSEAVRLYTEAYEEDYVSDSLIQAAAENYESAMKRIHYIASLLQSEIPQDANVTIEEDEAWESDTEG